MKKSNKIVVLIIVLLSLVLISGSAFAYIYLATDILKTDKQLFFKYFSQITSEEGFVDTRIKQYNDKKKQLPYENAGEITFEVQYPTEGLEEISEKVNDLSIKFNGKVDEKNEKVEQNINIDYGKNVVLPIHYKQDGNKYGIQTDELSKKFIAIKNENSKELINKLIGSIFDDNGFISWEDRINGIEESIEAPKDIIEEIEFSEEEKEQLKQTYGPILETYLLDEYFSKVKTKENESLTLEISFEHIKNIIIEMLKKTKENTLIIDKINNAVLKIDSTLEKMDSADIDEIIKDINESDVSKIDNLKITLVQNNKKLSQILIYNENTKITIEKKIVENSLTYNIYQETQEEEKEEIDNPLSLNNTTSRKVNSYFKVDYIGLGDSNEIQEKYEFGTEITEDDETMKFDYNIKFNTKFVDTVSIEELDGKVAIFLNDYTKEQLKPFLTQVGNKLLEINKNQMAKLGLKEYENPLIYTNPLGMTVISAIMIFNSASEQIEENINLSKYEIQRFNENFTRYNGTNVGARKVNKMLETVFNHNIIQEDESRCVAVFGDDEKTKEIIKATNTLTGLPTKVSEEKTYYEVICNIDPNTKLVNNIIVKEK